MIREILKNPISWVVGTLGAITALDPTTVTQLMLATWGNLGQLFSFTMIAGMTLPQFWPPESTLEYVILAIGAAFAAKMAHGIWQSYEAET